MSENIYFFIHYPRAKREEDNSIIFQKPKEKNKQPICIYTDDKYIVENNIYHCNKIFQVSKSNAKGKKNKYDLEFILKDDIYIISFEADKNTFIYEVNLISGKIILDIRRKIPQNKIEYKDKIEYFIEALKEDKEKINELYKDTLELYFKKKGFSLLIPLFLKIYNKKDLCCKLLEKFKAMNAEQKDNEKNMDRKAYLDEYKSDINEIAEKFYDNEDYNITYFYGIILCYLNWYDYEKFLSVCDDLYEKKNKDLYEILLIYNTHFKKPIKQDLKFFCNFIEYILEKHEFHLFKIGIGYIEDLEIYIHIIDTNKEKISKKYSNDSDNYILRVENKLKLNEIKQKKPEVNIKPGNFQIILSDGGQKAENDDNDKIKSLDFIPKMIDEIKSIIMFNRNEDKIIVYLTNDFWKYLLSCYKKPTQKNIKICFELREIFKLYYMLVKEKIKENILIKKDAKNYHDTDEFAFVLNKNIKIYFSNNNDLSNIEKLNFIKKYNPFYDIQEKRYSSRVDADIFDLFDISEINEEFIQDFRAMKFENIFKERIDEFIAKIFSKIKNIFTFDIIIRLINIKRFERKNNVLELLNRKYENIIKNDIEQINEKDLPKAIHIIAYFIIFNYIYQNTDKKNKFTEKKFKELSKDILDKVFIEIVKIYFDKKDEKDKQFKEEDDKKDKENNSEKNDNDSQLEEDNKNSDGDEIEQADKIDCTSEDNENDINYKDFKGLIEYIFDEYTKKLDDKNDIDNIIKLIDCLEGNIQNNEKKDNKNGINLNNDSRKEAISNFVEKLLKKYKFEKDEFFSSKKNFKILLLYELFEKKKIEKNDNNEVYEDIMATLNKIKIDIEGDIVKEKLDGFLKNDEDFLIKRLKLITILIEDFPYRDTYLNLKKRNKEISEKIEKLKNILDNISIYFNDLYKDQIKILRKTIKENQKTKIKEIEGGKINEIIKELDTKDFNELISNIEKVKNFLLFNTIYEMYPANTENSQFNNSLKILGEIGEYLISNNVNCSTPTEEKIKKYKDIIEKTNEKMSTKNEKESEEFIKDFINYYSIDVKQNEELIKKLNILFKSKKYEIDINSIIFFFENFADNNDDLNKNLSKYKNLSRKDFKDIKNILEELKKKDIYNYIKIEDYNKIFTCLYDKKEAIEFLFSKKGKDTYYLEDRIQPTTTTLTIEDIKSTQKCIEIMAELKSLDDNNERFKYIKSLKNNKEKEKEIITHFENYSKVFTSVIELDRYYDDSDNIYEQVKMLIEKSLSLNIYQYSENFSYECGDDVKEITMEELIHIKNKITIKEDKKNKRKNENNINSNTKGIEDEKNILEFKRETLLLFKNLIINLEIINEYMKDLRIKGSSLPIEINIKVKNMTNITYNLGDKIKNFDDIRNFLSKAKNNYNSQLDLMYREELNLRFLYGKQFRSFLRHLEVGASFNIDAFQRYILNITDNTKNINEGFIALKRNVEDYITYYDKYNRDSLVAISNYITTLFTKNHLSLEDHYMKMRMWPEEYKGIYLVECDDERGDNSMEKFILDLFWDKTRKLPIAQNVLITNEETSYEEIQTFLHRAILSNYNALFIIEINDSLSEYQQTTINTYVDKLLRYKKEIKEIDNTIDKKNTDEYLDSCIVFIYDKYNNNITSFLKEIKKLKKLSMTLSSDRKDIDIKNLGNIKVITSDFCGLGKSGKIRNEIEVNKKYFHLPLGGILSKNIIFDKLKNMLDKIKKNHEYKDVAIHLDLTESEEKSIINEFFFSFLITKFYMNNENIIYIPKDIDIYIEIPNCFKDYLSKFSILKIFKKENITFDTMPEFNYKKDILDLFNRMLGINTNQKIKEFVKKNIGINKYSFHQINIFIKLFISQYSKFDSKLTFLEDGKDVTEKCIKDFAKCTHYFTNGGFAKLLLNTDKWGNENYVDLLTKVYTSDLKDMKYPDPLIFIIKEKMIYDNFFVPTSDSDKYKDSNDYLNRMKQILNLPNKVKTEKNGLKSLISIIEENGNNYVITNDNFKKMVLLVYRIKANVPVIIMGETGCGKTALITKLNQLLNNGKTTVEIINIHPGINDEKLCKIMDEIDEKARKQNEELWLFFDEINTCLSLSLLTEIFINRAYYGKSISDNIRLIGACNPYRKRQKEKEECGLSLSDDKGNYGFNKDREKRKLNPNKDNDLVYLVNPLPQSLLYYVFSFGSIGDQDEKKYIHSIIEKSFSEEKEELKKRQEYQDKLKEKLEEFEKKQQSKSDGNEMKNIKNQIKSIEDQLTKLSSVKIHEITTEIISKCHIYLRENFDSSVVSLREIARFTNFVEFFKKYFSIKNKFNGENNNDRNNKIRSIICTIYLCYYIRLTDEEKRKNFEVEIRPILLKLINNGEQNNSEEKGETLLEQMSNEELKKEIKHRSEKIGKNFSDFLKIEQDYLIEQIKDLDKGIGKNSLLKENLFLLFVSILTSIPLIIIGKPGTGKSLSAQIIKKSMKGKYSSNKFFTEFKKIIQTYFQGSESTIPEDVENLFEKSSKKLKYYKDNIKDLLDLPISMALFDELGLAEKSESNPLKVLHSKLEYGGKEDGVSFVGISNYTLDAAKINRAIVLSVPDLDQKLDQLVATSTDIVQNISPKIKNDKIFIILSHTYFYYKQYLRMIKELVVCKTYCENYKMIKKDNKPTNPIPPNDNPSFVNLKKDLTEKKSIEDDAVDKSNYSDYSNQQQINNATPILIKGNFNFIKEEKDFKNLMNKEKKIRNDFHGNRDFYYLIKGVANDLGLGDYSDIEKVNIIIRHIERNFGGIEYEIKIDFNSRLEGIEGYIKTIKKILEDMEGYDENYMKVNSVYLFKKIFNLQCDDLGNSNLKIEDQKLNDYDLNKCINDNIRDINSRFSLLEIKSSLTTLICQNIISQNDNKNVKLYDGSPFSEDNNKEYRFIKLNEIINDAKEDQLVIIENLNQIHAFLYDLYNMNYEIIDNKKYARICLDNNTEQKALINNNFRIIILVDKRFVENCNLAFLNRLEKMNLSFGKLLDGNLKEISMELIEKFELKSSINSYKEIEYSLKDLLIGCTMEEIQGLIYYFSKKLKKNSNDDENEEQNEENIETFDKDELKEIVTTKIYKILPQDIIAILPHDNILRKKYIDNKEIYNFKDYLDYINKKENNNYKISIIYTFTSSAEIIEGFNNDMSLMISRIRSEYGLKYNIDEIKNRNENNRFGKCNYICIHFEQSNLKNIKFVCNFIINNFLEDEYNYIILAHINRNFNLQKRERIYSLPDINPYINQIFIDNLNDNKDIALQDLLNNDIQRIIIEKKDELHLDEEFNKTLITFIKNEFKEKEEFVNEYIKEISFINESDTKNKILEKVYNLIEENKEKDEDCKDIIEQIFKGNVNKFTLDIASCSIQFIKEKIFNKYLTYVLQMLENNNILTTLLENRKNDLLDENIIDKIMTKYLDSIKLDKNKQCKFLYNYNIPGFYNFFVSLSDYINQKIISNYFNKENQLRVSDIKNDSIINELHSTEENLVDMVNKEFSENNPSFVFVFDIINENPHVTNGKSNIIFTDLIFKDYITYYLQKYKNKEGFYNKEDIYHKILELLLNIRFNQNHKIIQSDDKIKLLLLKIIWIESNVSHILNIFKIIESAMIIFNGKENELYGTIEQMKFKDEENEKEENIRYIIDETINSEYTKEVNECFYLLLASICYSITSDNIKLDMNEYISNLKEINGILQSLNEDLNLCLNEMYIIDELIKIIEIFKYKNIERINKIKRCIIKSAQYIQKYANKNIEKLNEELDNNFKNLYKFIEEDDKAKLIKDNIYYNKLRYILFKEIKKISEPSYQYNVLKKLIKEKEMVKKSIDIFQVLLKNYLNPNDFKNYNKESLKNSNLNKILFGKDIIITFIDKELYDEDIALEETLLYLFEKNSLININNYINENKNLNEGAREMLNECIKFLDKYENKPDDVGKFLKQIGRLFALAYIKIYCYKFIKAIDDKKKFEINDVIQVLNGEKTICKSIRLYIYKIIYNNYSLDFISNDKIKEKYKLDKYIDFKDFQDIKEIGMEIDHKEVKTLKENYHERSLSAIEALKTKDFNGIKDKKDYNIEDFGIDNFYISSFNYTLSNLPNLDKNNFSDKLQKFYDNICSKLFNEVELKAAVEILYNPRIFKEHKRSGKIDSDSINPLLFGYRYCLNILYSKTRDGLYYQLYIRNNVNYISENFFPGNDTKYNSVYSNIKNHFKSKQDEGCYVCLCRDWYYYSVSTGFPERNELNKKCPKCGKNIGLFKRDNYFRIFKDENEKEKLRKLKINRDKMNEINCMTLKEFEEQYIIDKLKNEKGIYKTDKNNFRNTNKIIRNLSQISYRLLNYILYINLFFARIITKKKDMDKILPGEMSWTETISECWNLLKNELLQININSIEEFMNYIFVDLFTKLNKQKIIKDYDNLINFEDDLESSIQGLIIKFKEHKKSIENNTEEKISTINLLKEKYSYINFKSKEYPFYKYFLYTYYLNEENIYQKLKFLSVDQYPLLKLYLESKTNENKEKAKYSLEDLNLFNKALNLINQKYFNNISTNIAENRKLKDDDIYIKNRELFDKFIEFYNNSKIRIEGNILELNNENYLCDFFINENNKYGKSYKNIYNEFIKQQQNEEVEKILNMKNIILNKINIQQINEKEILTLKLPAEVSFIDIIFNSSYRKIIDDTSISYKEYVINFEIIEEILTELLLKNKKLLNGNITEFIYNNEVFNSQLLELIIPFKKKYTGSLLRIDAEFIYKFCQENKNVVLHEKIIKDFIEFIKHLINKNKEIKEESTMHEIANQIKKATSENFIKLFENDQREPNKGLTVGKSGEIFDFYLKCIFEHVKKEIKKYQISLTNKENLTKYFDNMNNPIKKKDLADAIRLFITLVLLQEDDKENKIKNNCNNIINYLKSQDLWNREVYCHKDFNKNINELKSLDIQINQIVFLYEFLEEDKEIEDKLLARIKNSEKEKSKRENEVISNKKKIEEIAKEANENNNEMKEVNVEIGGKSGEEEEEDFEAPDEE